MEDSRAAGLDADRLAHLKAAIAADIADDRYWGGVFIIARGGVIGCCEALGHASGARDRAVERNAVFSLLSMTKAFTSTVALRAVEQGLLGLSTRVAEVIPEFTGRRREHITLRHLLTHTSGMPPVFTPDPQMGIDRPDDMIDAICRLVEAEAEPGTRVDYSPLVNHALLGEMVRRVDPAGRRVRDILREDLFQPLGMVDSALGRRPDLAARHLVPDFRGRAPMEHLSSGHPGPHGAFEDANAEMPWVGAVATAEDVWRFAEMFRGDGAFDGARILSPATLARARTNHTGAAPDESFKRACLARGWPVVPASYGLGFAVRGEAEDNHMFGARTSPRTIGAYGAGTTLFWTDPDRDMTFVGLTTGMMAPAANHRRWRRYSDMAVSAAV